MSKLPRLYSKLAEWWPLVSGAGAYAVEAEHHWKLLTRSVRGPLETMLELGCGGGNNASHLKARCRMTLTDVSPAMLAVSRRQNPTCELIEADMRTMRLRDERGGPRVFDAVLAHDAILYMQTEADLRRAMATAYAHLRPGGAALFVPDFVRETWTPSTGYGGEDGSDGRAVRFLDWSWDPDPRDSEISVEIAYLLREADGSVHFEQDRHVFGLFATETWMRLLAEVGFEPAVEPCNYPGAERARSFVGVRSET